MLAPITHLSSIQQLQKEAGPLTGYIPTLDGWRAVAVLLVILFHAVGEQGPAWLRAFPFGFLGVDIFFALSGFLICTRLLEEQRRRGHISLSGFYIRRAFRIFPPAWIYLAALAALAGVGALSITRSEMAGCLLLFRNYYPSGQHWYTIHFWSLAVEEHFYFFFPALLAWYGRDIGRARWVVLFLALLVAVVRSCDFAILELFKGRLPAGTFFWTRTHVRLDALLWGCFAAMTVERHRERLARWISSPALTVLLFATAAGAFFVPLSLTWRSLLLPWMVAGTALRPGTWLGVVLESSPMRWVGRLSYSLYLWQQLFCVGELTNRSEVLAPLQAWPWNAPALFVCAATSYYLIERPLIRLGHRLAKPTSEGRV
jgi:peptidoglycan/LPS O-acetylase OafA/YrhL